MIHEPWKVRHGRSTGYWKSTLDVYEMLERAKPLILKPVDDDGDRLRFDREEEHLALYRLLNSDEQGQYTTLDARIQCENEEHRSKYWEA